MLPCSRLSDQEPRPPELPVRTASIRSRLLLSSYQVHRVFEGGLVAGLAQSTAVETTRLLLSGETPNSSPGESEHFLSPNYLIPDTKPFILSEAASSLPAI